MISNLSVFLRGSVIPHNPLPVKDSELFQVDQFTASEFFMSDSGLPLRDYQVYALSESNSELRRKMQDYMILRDISQSNDGLTDDQIEQSIVSKYDDSYSLIDRVKSAIRNWRDSSSSDLSDKVSK